jgi:hypothetical protein
MGSWNSFERCSFRENKEFKERLIWRFIVSVDEADAEMRRETLVL